MDKKKRKRTVKSEEKGIRSIIDKWDLIPGVPDDEYDCLVHKIISRLHRGVSEKEIQPFIQKKIKEHFGIEADDYIIRKLSNKIYNFWIQEKR